MIDLIVNDKKTYQIPTSWDELSTDQYLVLINNINTLQDPADVINSLLFYIIHPSIFTSITIWRGFDADEYLSKELVDTVHPLMQWIFEKPKFNKVPIIDIECDGELYVSPKAGLINITGAEIVMLEYFRTAYEITKEDKYLYKLVAVLYRPYNTNEHSRMERGDDRLPFNDNLIDKYALLISKSEKSNIFGIYFWYCAVMAYKYEQYSDVFSSGTGTTTAKDPEEWRHIIRSLRNNKMGNQKEVNEAYIGDILYEMRKLEQEAQALEKLNK
jgi:hypothetical protein